MIDVVAFQCKLEDRDRLFACLTELSDITDWKCVEQLDGRTITRVENQHGSIESRIIGYLQRKRTESE